MANSYIMRSLIVGLLGLSATIATAIAISVPAAFIWPSPYEVIGHSIYRDSKLTSLILVAICAIIASVPFLSNSTCCCYFPFAIGISVICWSMLLTVMFILGPAYCVYFYIGIYPQFIGAQAMTGILLLTEGLVVKHLQQTRKT